MPAWRWRSPADSCCCCSNSSKRRAPPSRRTRREPAALDGRALALRHRPLRRDHQPALRASHRLPHGRAVLDLCSAAGRGISLGRRRAHLLRPSAGDPGGRSGGAGARAHRHRRRRHGDRAAAGAGAASPQAPRHGRSGRAAAASVMTEILPPLAVALPLGGAALLLLVGRLLPWRIPDGFSVLVALAVLAADAAMAAAAAKAPLVYWFGGWAPRGSLVLGIGFVVGQADAAVAAVVALLFAASFVFAWGYFEDIRAFFHVLMLLFLAAMQGFCLTHDLFNLFVWFEVMSVAAFALTA